MKVNLDFGIEGARKASLRGDVIVVIDVLRASSTISTALYNGAEEVIVVEKIEDALKLAEKCSECILAGERRGIKIEGFKLGNSPLEFSKDVVLGKTIVFTSSNCAPIIEAAKNAPIILLGCFLNLSSTASYILNLLERHSNDVTIIYAGRYGKPCSDDLLCAEILYGLIKGEISQPPLSIIIKNFLQLTPSGRYLISIGHLEDVLYCGEVDKLTIVPVKMKHSSGFKIINVDDLLTL